MLKGIRAALLVLGTGAVAVGWFAFHGTRNFADNALTTASRFVDQILDWVTPSNRPPGWTISLDIPPHLHGRACVALATVTAAIEVARNADYAVGVLAKLTDLHGELSSVLPENVLERAIGRVFEHIDTLAEQIRKDAARDGRPFTKEEEEILKISAGGRAVDVLGTCRDLTQPSP